MGHWGPPPGYPAAPQYQPYPQPRKRSAAPVLIGVGVVLLVFLLAAGCLAAMTRTASQASRSLTSIRATDDYPGFGPPGTWTRTAVTPTPTTPTAPPLPTGYAALGGNALWANPDWGLQNVPCSPPGWPSDTASARAFFDAALACLDTGWRQLVEAAGQEFQPTTVLVPSGTVVQSPCGTESVGPTHNPAFYCGSNATIYMPLEGMPGGRFGSKAVIYLSMVAHEYGHHVQALVGALDEEGRQANTAGFDSAAGLELSRRLELQAQCFSGMFIGSIANVNGRTGGRFGQQDIDIAYDDALRGDWEPDRFPRDHGTPQHGQGWWLTGDTTNRVSRCNTWNASSADVS
ncbi:hypothetical protein BOO86_17300 [Mycobacterium sp. CBMA 234]|nr:hypothetical protein [Mycolicibacterium sp. CBMA 234]